PAEAARASCRRSSRRSVRAQARSSSAPTWSPARATTSSGSLRQATPSSSTATRSPRSPRSAVIRDTGRTAVLRSTVELLSRRDLLTFLLLRRRLARGGRGGRGGEEPGRGDLLGTDRRLDPREDLVRHVRVLAQERGRVLATLAEP